MVDEKEPDLPSLIVEGGPIDGFVFPLNPGTSILVGSGRLAQLRVGSDEVGAAHIRVTWDDNGIAVTDNGSVTGTFVNGEQIETALLMDRDLITFAPAGTKGVQAPKIRVKIPAGSVMIAPAPPEPVAVTPAKPAAADPKRPFLPKVHKTARPAKGFALPGFLSSISLPSFSLPSLSLPSLPSVSPKAIGVAGGALVLLVVGVLLLQRFFFSAPVVTAIQPAESQAGAIVTITGKRVHPEAPQNHVLFGDQSVTAIASTGATLTVSVPEAPATGGRLSLVVETPRGRSKPVPFVFYTPLRLTAFEAEAEMPGQEVTAKGAGFAEGAASVTVAGKAAQVVEARRDGLRFKVPDLEAAEGSVVPVVVRVGNAAARPVDLILGRLPVVLAVSPARGGPGDKVVLKGRGFASDAAGNAVTFAGVPAFVLAASTSELSVLAPNTGLERIENQAPVVVTAGGKGSTNQAFFTVVRPAGSAFTLRFYPAAVAAGNVTQAYVASDMGPLLLLASPAGAPSLIERAARSAAALNAAFDRALTGQAVVFEARAQPAAGIGIVGAPDQVAAITPEDVAAYGPAGTAPPAPAALAAHGAALAIDYLAVFVKGEKPYQVLAVSPLGRSLVDLRTALAPRPGAPISTERVAGLSPELLSRLRMAALGPGGGGDAGAGGAAAGPGPGAAAVLEGQWDGEMQDQNAAPKPITVRLQVTGPRIEGKLTNRSLAISMDVALRDVTFGGGVLSFTLPAGPATRTFRGKVAGSSITGTLHATPTGPSVGTFSLRNEP